MDIRRFKEIISYSRSHHQRIEQQVKDFYTRIGVDHERELLDIMQVTRPLLRQNHNLVIELPFADKEIGALYYKGDQIGYTILNSSLPRVNVNFALCHEIYHIFYQEREARRKTEFYRSEHYYDDHEEFSANLFAGILMMPTQSFQNMFRNFHRDAESDATGLSIVVKLMNYFKVPYMAALIRCYELNLLEGGSVLQSLIQVDGNRVKQLFLDLWLDDNLLNPTKKDDFRILEFMALHCGRKYIDDELITEHTVQKALHNMRQIYQNIKGE